MRAGPRTAALIGAAVVVLVAPLAAMRVLTNDPADPRLSVGAAAPATLIPGDVRDRSGRMLAGALWTGLTSYDPRTAAPVNAAAESVTPSRDLRTWTIRLRPGGRFHDGSPVTAGSFTGAWTATMRERWHGAALLTDVAQVKTLKAADPRTITMTLKQPFNALPSLLADPAFLPMPEAVLRSRDWRSYDRMPIGNGPYRIRGRTAGEIVLSRPGARDLVVRAMPAGRQYDAVRSGDLDVATEVPGDEHESMDSDFKGRHRTVPGREMTYLAFPMRDKRFAVPGVRHALSLAIDRRAVADGPLGYQATPATSLVPQGIALGRRDDVCRICVHDARAAAALLADAGGWRGGPLTLWHGPGDERWLKAVAGQIRGALKLDVRLRSTPANGGPDEPDGPFVIRGSGAYPSAAAALRPVVAAPTGHPDRYPAGQLAAAERAARPEDGVIPARLAESTLLRDLPAIPLWSDHGHLVWSSRTRGVAADAFAGLRLASLSLKK